MDKLQFLVLYRQFLFRMVDFEILSAQAQGDMSKLFGQFASLMISISVVFAIVGLSSSGGRLPPLPRVLLQWTLEHFLITATMLIAGIFALLSWDATFPDKRDVMALGPLPIRARTLFLAKVTGVGLALSLAVITLHSLCSFTFIGGLASQPAIVFAGEAIPQTGGFTGLIRAFAGYWIVMFAAAAFIFGCVLTLQGIAAILLPRTLYLRASSVLQLAAFCVMVSGALLEPTEATPRSLAAAQGNGWAAWQFTFWFLGLFQQIKGSPALAVLAHRAWLGLACIAVLTAAVYSLGYFRMMRKIVEEPDILPSTRALRWLPSFGNAFQTAISHFSVHCLLRSRQHRMILAFYLGIAFAANVLLLRMPAAQDRANSWAALGTPLLATTILSMLVSVIGMRIAFAMPLDLKANWIFRIAPVREPAGAPARHSRGRPLSRLARLRRSAVLDLAVARGGRAPDRPRITRRNHSRDLSGRFSEDTVHLFVSARQDQHPCDVSLRHAGPAATHRVLRGMGAEGDRESVRPLRFDCGPCPGALRAPPARGRKHRRR